MNNQEEIRTNTKKSSWAPFTIVSIGFGICLIAITFFQWDLIDYLSVFFLPLLILVFWVVLAIITMTSLIYIPFQLKIIRWKSILPLIANIITILILYVVPFTSLWLDFKFRVNKQGYEQAIKMYENGELNEPNKSGYIELPSEYKYLSKGGGDIIVDNSDGITSIFFYTFRGILGSSSGFIYRSNDSPPPQFLLRRDCYQLERIEPKWFFCASD
jgi:hypothetical protein